jgi:glycosyltransferase involved in cell wall biosynthesis
VKERPLVSIVVPAYNAAAFVGDAIDSALAQSYRPIEILVADDGSCDATAAVVRAYGEPVRYLHQENSGPAGARNLALRHARGEYVAFLDADDVWHPRKLAVQVPLMEGDPRAGICGAQMRGFRDLRELRWEEPPGEAECAVVDAASVITRNRFSTSTVVVRAAALREAGEFDVSIFGPEDWDLWRRIMQRWGGLSVRAVLAGYREREQSVSSNAARMLENNRKVLRKSFADNPGLPWHRKLKALSYLHLDATLEYLASCTAAAAWHLALSLALWPAPLGRDCCRPLTRAKLAVRLPLQMLGLWGGTERKALRSE